ncbi:F-box domain protein [Geosmithia morbida]|uniref:F-box domain protein n=1 Tax=Geosmithia morbida TaxID=1094350 RepID=A0A9P5D3Y0_9HYPO|nr:F-box domain protein [Geosmithia morbida]KAF4120949.1 F-box domain protein [Geosmithia morbida]
MITTASSQDLPGPPVLAGLPMEILLDIYRHLDIGSIYQLSLASKFFHELFSNQKIAILLPALVRDFSPLDELLQVYTASADDLGSTYGALYKPRRVVFKRFAGDSGLILATGPSTSSQGQQQPPPQRSFANVVNGRRPGGSANPAFRTVTMSSKDIAPLLKLCQLVLKWEELFPSMRWFYQPESCRSLRQHEKERFRRAFYCWWLYGIYFHGNFPRPRIGLPEPHADDIRTSLLRYRSTSELLELMDLVETMKDVILHYICPRLDPNQQSHAMQDQPVLIDSVDRGQSLSESWDDQSRWSRIVKTYVKLGPRELMYYFENIYSYPRKRLISEIQLHHPTLCSDQESIQVAVRCVLDERQWLDKVISLAEDRAGGVIDFDDERDGERVTYGNDGSPDGSLPDGAKFIRSHSQYSPRGDDGSCLEDVYYRHAALDRGPAVASPFSIGTR